MRIKVTSNNSLLISIDRHLIAISRCTLAPLTITEAVHNLFFIALWQSLGWWSHGLFTNRSTG